MIRQSDCGLASYLPDDAMWAAVTPELAGTRADAAAAELFKVSRSAAIRLIENGDLYIVPPKGGRELLRKSRIMREGEILRAEIPEPEPAVAEPENIPLDIIYEDEDIIIINKPQGMVVHPAPGHAGGTLVSALLYHCGNELSGIGGVLRPGIVHRIDKDTSGLIAAAKNDVAHTALAAQLEDHSMRREYRAIVIGGFRSDTGTIDAPIARHPSDRKRMAVVKSGGRRAVTHWNTDKSYSGFTLLRLRLETGRTHQIRVHMSCTGHPVLGDPLYGGDGTPFQKKHPALFNGQCLHAEKLTLTHPRTAAVMTFTAPPPKNFSEILRIMEAVSEG